MHNEPLISVVIPVHNCERYLAEAIESVLAQTYRPIEIIVVDDGSTDGSADIAERFVPPVRYCFQLHSGAGAARNHGIECAGGSFFAFLDADDLWMKGKLVRQMAAFREHPQLAMVFGHVEQFHSPELGSDLKDRIRYPAETMPGYMLGAMLVRRDAFLRVGPFETKWQVGEFVDWYSRALEQGLKSFVVPQMIVRRRLHSDNLGIRERDSQMDYLRVLKASLDRRRKTTPPGQGNGSESRQ